MSSPLFGTVLGLLVSLQFNCARGVLGSKRSGLLRQYAGVVYTCPAPFLLAGAVVDGAWAGRRLGVDLASGLSAVLVAVAGVLLWLGWWVTDDAHVIRSGARNGDGDDSGDGNSGEDSRARRMEDGQSGTVLRGVMVMRDASEERNERRKVHGESVR